MLKASIAPHRRLTERPFYAAGGVLLCIAALTAFSCLYYGIRPAILVAVGAVSAVLVELLCCVFGSRAPALNDGTSALTGALVGCMMSPLTPFWVPAIGAAFAIGVAKMPFGGTGRNMFNPAAAGVAFCAICFPTRLFVYPDPSQPIPLPLGDTSSVITALSPAAQLSNNGAAHVDTVSLLSGNFSGPIGSAGVIVLIACALYLCVRRSASPIVFCSYIGTCALLAWAFPRSALPAADGILLELCTGLLLFTGVFLMGDPCTAPRYWLARVLYGVCGGAMVMLLRHYGRFECCEFFAVLLVNALSPMLDRVCWRAVRRLSEVVKA